MSRNSNGIELDKITKGGRPWGQVFYKLTHTTLGFYCKYTYLVDWAWPPGDERGVMESKVRLDSVL
jgi:hypothetical protein